MAQITTGSTFGITRQQLLAVQLMAEGKSLDDIAICCFDCRTEDGSTTDEAKLRKAKARLVQWRRSEKVQAAYKAILLEGMMPAIALAAGKLVEQISDPQGWLSNKAANDVLTRFMPQLFHEDSNVVTVRVEGMPQLGVPEDD